MASHPGLGASGYAIASFEGLSFHLDGTVSVRSALTHAPDCYRKYLPSQNGLEHCSEPRRSACLVEGIENHSLRLRLKYLPLESTESQSSSFSIISNASISSFQSANMESIGWTFLPQLTLGFESSSVSDCS